MLKKTNHQNKYGSAIKIKVENLINKNNHETNVETSIKYTKKITDWSNEKNIKNKNNVAFDLMHKIVVKPKSNHYRKKRKETIMDKNRIEELFNGFSMLILITIFYTSNQYHNDNKCVLLKEYETKIRQYLNLMIKCILIYIHVATSNLLKKFESFKENIIIQRKFALKLFKINIINIKKPKLNIKLLYEIFFRLISKINKQKNKIKKLSKTNNKIIIKKKRIRLTSKKDIQKLQKIRNNSNYKAEIPKVKTKINSEVKLPLKIIESLVNRNMASKKGSLAETASMYKMANGLLTGEDIGSPLFNIESPFATLNPIHMDENYVCMEDQLNINGQALEMIKSIQKKDLTIKLNAIEPNKEKNQQKKKKETNILPPTTNKRKEESNNKRIETSSVAFGRTVQTKTNIGKTNCETNPKSNNGNNENVETEGKITGRVKYKELATQMASKNNE